MLYEVITYSRALAESLQLLRNKEGYSERSFTYWVVFVAIACMAILFFFKSALLVMLGFAMTMAFMTTPFFAWMNHHLVKTTDMPDELRPGKSDRRGRSRLAGRQCRHRRGAERRIHRHLRGVGTARRR